MLKVKIILNNLIMNGLFYFKLREKVQMNKLNVYVIYLYNKVNGIKYIEFVR